MTSGKTADVGRDHGNLARHRFERRQPEALLRGRQQEDVGRRQERNHQLLRAEYVRAVRDAQLASEPIGRAQLRPVTDQQQPRRRRVRLIRAKTCITASMRLTGLKFETWITSFVSSLSAKRRRSDGSGRRL